jgi:hypothetical protein
MTQHTAILCKFDHNIGFTNKCHFSQKIAEIGENWRKFVKIGENRNHNIDLIAYVLVPKLGTLSVITGVNVTI